MDGSNAKKDEAVRELLAANHFEQDKAMKNTKAGLRNEWFVGKMFSPKVCPHYKEMRACCNDDMRIGWSTGSLIKDLMLSQLLAKRTVPYVPGMSGSVELHRQSQQGH